MIAAIKETKWLGSEFFDTSAYRVCYSCNKEHKLLLTALMIRKGVKAPMLNFEPIDDHICYLKLKSKFSTSLLFFLFMLQLRTEMIQLKIPSMTH
jgi:hypothetical protein